MHSRTASAGPRPARGGRLRAWSAACALLLASAAPPARAEPIVLTLREAVERALSEGVAARIARLEAEQAGDSYLRERGAYLPQLAITSNAGWSNRLNDKFVAAAPDLASTVKLPLASLGTDRGWLNVVLSQILFDLKEWRLIEREELAAEAARLAETRDRDDLTYEVTRRYANVLRVEQQLRRAQERLVDGEWLFQQADTLYQAGRVLELDHSMAAIYRQEAELETRDLQRELRSARQELWGAIGEGEAPPSALTLAAESLPPLTADLDPSLPEQAVTDSPELRILDLQRRMEEKAAGAARAGRLPTMKLVSGYSNYGPKRFDSFEDEIWVGVDFQIPIFDGLRAKNAIRGADRGVEIARLRYESALADRRARIEELHGQVQSAVERVALAERRATAAGEEQRIADLNLQAGRGGLRESQLARERRALLDRAAVDARFQQVELWAELQRELGRLGDRIGAATASP